ncbi:MAG: ABC transporter substrate-binding protein [Rhodospirillaceae bacterium]
MTRRSHFIIILLCAAILFASQATEANTLRIATAGRVPNLGNPYASMMTRGMHPSAIMFDGLTKLSSSGDINPVLATFWEATGPNRWEFKLRQNVKFANGEPFNSDAVVAVFDFLKSDEARGLFMAGEARNIRMVNALDEHTVEFITIMPDAILPKRLSLIFMVPPKAWMEMGQDEFGLHPIGTGPYQLDDWGFQSGIYEMLRVPGSWRATTHDDVPDRIAFYVAADAVSRSQSLISGQTHLVTTLGLDMLLDLEAQGFATQTLESPHIEGLALRNIDPDHPLADARVRQALNIAIDRQTMADIILHGKTQPNSQGALPQTFGFNPDIPPYPYDPERARQLVAEAGYDKGLVLEAIVRTQATTPETLQIYQKVAQDLSNIGVTMHIRGVQAAQWIGMWFSGDWKGADVLAMNWSSSIYMDAIRSIENASCLKPAPFFCETKMVPRIESSNSLFDPLEREKELQAMMAELHTLAPTILLFPEIHTFAFDSALGPLEFDGEMLRMDAVRMSGLDVHE